MLSPLILHSILCEQINISYEPWSDTDRLGNFLVSNIVNKIKYHFQGDRHLNQFITLHFHSSNQFLNPVRTENLLSLCTSEN